jgi:hypothetical protein
MQSDRPRERKNGLNSRNQTRARPASYTPVKGRGPGEDPKRWAALFWGGGLDAVRLYAFAHAFDGIAAVVLFEFVHCLLEAIALELP